MCFAAACGLSAEQGEWLEAEYSTSHDGKTKDHKVAVNVESSKLWAGNLIIKWRAKNIGRVATGYDWRNKAVMDRNGNLFSPQNGTRSKTLQPTETSQLLKVSYKLPPGADTSQLDWGWFDPDKEDLAYKIRLHPDGQNLLGTQTTTPEKSDGAASQKATETEGPQVVEIGLMQIPLKDPGRVMSLELAVEVAPSDVAEVNRLKVQWKQMIVQKGSLVTYESLAGVDGKIAFRDQLLTSMNELAKRKIIRRVYFTQFIVQ
jgi:flagellar protein FliL